MAQADVDKLKQDLTRRMDGALETLRREGVCLMMPEVLVR